MSWIGSNFSYFICSVTTPFFTFPFTTFTINSHELSLLNHLELLPYGLSFYFCGLPFQSLVVPFRNLWKGNTWFGQHRRFSEQRSETSTLKCQDGFNYWISEKYGEGWRVSVKVVISARPCYRTLFVWDFYRSPMTCQPLFIWCVVWV